MPITIQEIIASDTISQFVDKTNFNFDQLLLNGGGPGGPTGPKGPTGPGGGRGPKGSTWYEDIATSSPGNNPNTVSPTATPFDKDYYLQFNGVVWEYNGTTTVWDITTIDLQGPPGATGGGGGFGLTIGSPVINQSNIRYNGPMGLNNGANTLNEGVPSILIGGVTSLTNALTGIPFTGAYIVPDTIITGNSSYLTSLLIHQKDSQSRGIVFHGGAAIGSGDNYEQSDPAQLSNISIGVDDSLVLSVPKGPTSPTAQPQLLGFQLLTPLRSQQFFAGSDIAIQSGDGPSTIDFAGQHSNIEINVGVGGTSGAGSLFKAITQGSASSTLLEAGNTTNITLVTNQALQQGKWQLQAGEIRMVSSSNKNLGLYSGGDLRLNTLDSGGSFQGTGGIVLSAGVGGINLNSVNLGNLNGNANNIGFTANDDVTINAGDELKASAVNLNRSTSSLGSILIEQLATNAGASPVTTGKSINIRGNAISSTNASPTTQTVGQIRIANYTNLILGKAGTTNYQQFPSIIIDQDYYLSDPAKVQPHTRFTGKQTWQYAKIGNSNIVYSEVSGAYQYNNIDGVIGSEVFRQTGDNVYSPGTGVSMEMWRAGSVTSGGVNQGILSGLIQIRQGSELTQYGSQVQGTAWDAGAATALAYDSTLSLTIRNDFYTNPQAGDNQYFSVNSNKTAIGNPIVYNRTQDQSVYGNIAPLTTSSFVVDAGSTDKMAQNSPRWGFDFRNDTTPPSTVTSFLGMPTTADLTSPLIKLQYGLGVGQLPGSTITTSNGFVDILGPGTNSSGVDTSFGFPIGMYPGQRITLVIENYAVRGGIAGVPGRVAVFFGAIRINIPANRSATSEAGLQAADWYYDGGVNTNLNYGVTSAYPGTNLRRNFVQVVNETAGTGSSIAYDDSSNCATKTMIVDMIWDGTVTSSWGSVSNINFNPPVVGQPYTPSNTLNEVWTQSGWRIISEKENVTKDASTRYGRNKWTPFPL